MKEYHEECNFENQNKSFSDFMQSQMSKKSQLILPDAVVAEDSYRFYNKGKEMFKNSY